MREQEILKPLYHSPKQPSISNVLEIQKVHESFLGEKHTCHYKIKCPVFFGHTLGSALKRTILFDTPGAAIVAVNISNCDHFMQGIPGIKETTIEITQRLKEIRFQIKEAETKNKPDYLHVRFSTQRVAEGTNTVLKASQMDSHPYCTVINGDHIICTLDDSKNAAIEIWAIVATGKYFRSESEHKISHLQKYFAVDAQFTTVNCSYDVVKQTSGDVPYETIILQLTTFDGQTPQEIIETAASTLVEAFSFFLPKNKDKVEEKDDELMNKRLDTLPKFPARAYNALFNHGIETIGHLISKTPEEISVITGVGNQTLSEIVTYLEKYKLVLKGSK